ncbi:MAG: SufD family Fe-S cluster assembly protein [bacterium]|nr:SufD family Fe-S cluster assembly protein [bacterium]MDZ4296197.1 SufD family Fe-S cluster assembly protein [Patescibacteria group bacterium]
MRIQSGEKRRIFIEDAQDVTVELAGEGAAVELYGLVKASGTEEVTTKARIVHQAPRTKSTTVVRGVLEGKACNDFQGLIRVEAQAKGAEASLRYDALLLSPEAKAKALPSLEILTEDAKVYHAASITNLDEEKLFYLQSRGLNRREAEQVIVTGFVKAVKK